MENTITLMGIPVIIYIQCLHYNIEERQIIGVNHMLCMCDKYECSSAD